VSLAALYEWRATSDGMDLSDAKTLTALEAEREARSVDRRPKGLPDVVIHDASEAIRERRLGGWFWRRF
jgi:hypothetical protein